MTDTATIERHDTGPKQSWRSSLVNARRLRSTILERRPRSDDGAALLDCDRDCAAILSVLEEAPEKIMEALALGAGGGAAGAMAQSARGGFVLLRQPGRSGPRTIPAGAAGMTPLLWRDALMLALVARDPNAQAILIDPARIAACQLGARADAFWAACCRALAAAAAGRVDAPDEIAAALAEMTKVEIADPNVIEALDRPLLRLAESLSNGGADWNETVLTALVAHRNWYADETRRYDRTGFLATGIVGLCALAHGRGIETTVRSPYIPAPLIRGEPRAPLSKVLLAPGVSLATPEMSVAIATAEGLKELLRPVLMALRGPDRLRALASLRPRDSDHAKVFVEAVVEGAREKYEALWRAPPPFPAPDPLRTDLHIDLAPAGMLDHDNFLSRRFPLGFRAIAHLLIPERIWAAWEFVEPGRDSGLAFDGLVWCDDHWAWYPRPYRLLGRADS
jgi:Immunity protein 49